MALKIRFPAQTLPGVFKKGGFQALDLISCVLTLCGIDAGAGQGSISCDYNRPVGRMIKYKHRRWTHVTRITTLTLRI